MQQLPDYNLLAQQFVYDASKTCVANELLFRNPLNLSAQDVGGDMATNQVLANFCASITEQVDGFTQLAFINIDSHFLLNNIGLPVAADRVVIDLDGDVRLSNDIIEALEKWKSKGFKFSLDGYRDIKDHHDLLKLVDYVKVDVLTMEIDDLRQLMANRPAGQQIWIASRIEDNEVFEACKNIGFEWFQGYFLARPTEVLGSSIRPGTAVTVRIIKELDKPGISMKEIAKLVAQDPKLSVQMIKIINSPLFNLPRPVTDIESAITYLGIDMLRQWAMILAFLSNGSTHIEGCRMVLLRAKACELQVLKQSRDDATAAAAFLAGLVSGVDVLLNIEPDLFLKQVSLSDSITDAVCHKKGVIGEELARVKDLAYNIAQHRHRLGEFDTQLLQVNKDASEWVDGVIKVLSF